MNTISKGGGGNTSLVQSQSTPCHLLFYSASRSFTNLRRKWLQNDITDLVGYAIIKWSVIPIGSNLKWFPGNITLGLLSYDHGLNLLSQKPATTIGHFLIGTIGSWQLCRKLNIPMADRIKKKLLWTTQKPAWFFPLYHSFLALHPIVLLTSFVNKFFSIIQ